MVRPEARPRSGRPWGTSGWGRRRTPPARCSSSPRPSRRMVGRSADRPIPEVGGSGRAWGRANPSAPGGGRPMTGSGSSAPRCAWRAAALPHRAGPPAGQPARARPAPLPTSPDRSAGGAGPALRGSPPQPRRPPPRDEASCQPVGRPRSAARPPHRTRLAHLAAGGAASRTSAVTPNRPIGGRARSPGAASGLARSRRQGGPCGRLDLGWLGRSSVVATAVEQGSVSVLQQHPSGRPWVEAGRNDLLRRRSHPSQPVAGGGYHGRVGHHGQ
jgi:hypothetical protein